MDDHPKAARQRRGARARLADERARNPSPMPYLLTPEQQQISDEARRLLSQTYSSETLKRLLEQDGAYDEAFWASCRDMGWTGVTIPEEYGGLGLSAVELCLILQECGRVVCGAPYLTTSFAVGEALRLWGDEAARTALLPGLAAGDLKGALAFAEGPGEIIPAQPALSLRNGRLYGAKASALGGAAAELGLVIATDEAGAPRLAIADLRAGGVTRTPVNSLDNSRGYTDLTFDGTPATVLEGDGIARANEILQRLAVVTAFEQLGGADICLQQARDYALQRFAFGQPIGKFQGIKHKIAEMYVLNELVRGSALRAALALAEDGPPALDAAAARLNAITAFEYAASEAIQVHGGVGVTWEHDLHLYYRRSRVLALELGSAATWEDLIVDALAEAA
jgi:acyl-CoA dehydrogenase